MWYSVVYFKLNMLLCYTVVSVLVLVSVSLEANIIGYRVLGTLFGIVLTLSRINAGVLKQHRVVRIPAIH